MLRRTPTIPMRKGQKKLIIREFREKALARMNTGCAPDESSDGSAATGAWLKASPENHATKTPLRAEGGPAWERSATIRGSLIGVNPC